MTFESKKTANCDGIWLMKSQTSIQIGRTEGDIKQEIKNFLITKICIWQNFVYAEYSCRVKMNTRERWQKGK